ncbi:MAG TPA: hypothetical protein VGN88_03320 [Phycisphaerae bacterium]|jgi:hypothetical protein
MQFLIHGELDKGVAKWLAKEEHVCHTIGELPEDSEGVIGDPAVLLPLLAKKQWNLITTDSQLVRSLYDKKVLFAGVVVHILEEPGAKLDGLDAVKRLFERYKRLTARRLYTVTPSRVKIRQLPGAAEA